MRTSPPTGTGNMATCLPLSLIHIYMFIRDRYKAIVVILIVAVQSEELRKLKKRMMAKHTSKTVEGGAA